VTVNTDAFGVSVSVGDAIVYVVRNGSSVRLVKAVVEALGTRERPGLRVRRIDATGLGPSAGRAVLRSPTFVRVGSNAINMELL
jgi:hypothetical protein